MMFAPPKGELRSARRIPPLRGVLLPILCADDGAQTVGVRTLLSQSSGQGADEFAVAIAAENLEADQAAFAQTAAVSACGILIWRHVIVRACSEFILRNAAAGGDIATPGRRCFCGPYGQGLRRRQERHALHGGQDRPGCGASASSVPLPPRGLQKARRRVREGVSWVVDSWEGFRGPWSSQTPLNFGRTGEPVQCRWMPIAASARA